MKRLLVLFAFVLPAIAQLPEGSQVNLYFPQLADGGDAVQRWQTWLIFVNPSSQTTAFATLRLYANDGSPLPLDLGQGLNSSLNFSVPPRGRVTFRSTIASPTIVTGWAKAAANIPLQATVLFRALTGNTPVVDLAAPATLPSFLYRSPANRNLGIALANVYGIPISATVKALDQNGAPLGSVQVPLPALGHSSFTLWQKLPSLPSDYLGSVEISTTTLPDVILAWTLNEDSGLLSTLPSGRLEWPIAHPDAIWLAYQRVLDAAHSLQILTGADPQLRILPDKEVNAYARNGSEVGITLGLSELISDSPSELAFALAHEVGHIYQQRNGGRLDFYPTNREFDADIWGSLLALVSDYDPYAAAGTLAKLAMATGNAGLTQQFEEQLASDAHKSFNTRLDTIFDAFVRACNSSAELQKICSNYKSIIHPDLPPVAPLSGGEATRNR